MLIARGEQSGEIVRDGKSKVKQYDLFCLNHRDKNGQVKPIKMIQVLTYENGNTEIYGKTCQKCHQYFEEGRIEEIKEAEK